MRVERVANHKWFLCSVLSLAKICLYWWGNELRQVWNKIHRLEHVILTENWCPFVKMECFEYSDLVKPIENFTHGSNEPTANKSEANALRVQENNCAHWRLDFDWKYIAMPCKSIVVLGPDWFWLNIPVFSILLVHDRPPVRNGTSNNLFEKYGGPLETS